MPRASQGLEAGSKVNSRLGPGRVARACLPCRQAGGRQAQRGPLTSLSRRTRRKLIGAGIDLISWHRLERFLLEHSYEFIRRLFSPSEQKIFQKTPFKLRFFGRSFAAKEAYFKAVEGRGMSPEVFGGLQTKFKGRSRFWVGPSSPARFDPMDAEGTFFECPKGVGASLLLWRKDRS